MDTQLPAQMLAFHREVATEFIAEDSGLLVMADGLHARAVLNFFIDINSRATNLVFLVNTPAEEELQIIEELSAYASPTAKLTIVTNQYTSDQRADMYRRGGVFSVTSRILVMDFLTHKVPAHLVTGILVNHAEEVNDMSTESFILRLYRQENQEGFIRAFSSAPDVLVAGYMKLEKTMKALFLRNLVVRPRFHVNIASCLDRHPVDTVELQIPLTESMKLIQTALLEIINACISELRRATSIGDVDELTVENAMFQSFDIILRKQLEPVWHRLGHKSKQLVNDLRLLRKLLKYVIEYDAVTFYSFLETILAGENDKMKSSKEPSPWLIMDAAATMFTVAKERVYRKQPSRPDSSLWWEQVGVAPAVEELPKWNLLQSVLDEIRQLLAKERSGQDPEQFAQLLEAPILIMCAEERTCRQLGEYLSIPWSTSAPETQDAEANTGDEGSHEPHPMTMRLLRNYFRWKLNLAKLGSVQVVEDRRPQREGRAAFANNENSPSGRGGGRGGAPPNKRRRVRGGSTAAVQSAGRSLAALAPTMSDIADVAVIVEAEQGSRQAHTDNGNHDGEDDADYLFDPQAFSEHFGLLEPTETFIFRSYHKESDYGYLQEIRPRFIVIYDPNPTFVRQVEVLHSFTREGDMDHRLTVRARQLYQATHPNVPVRAYFLTYKDSVEEQRYLGQIRKEKDAFEKIIRQKSVMAIPLDQDGRVPADPDLLFNQALNSRVAGGQQRELVMPRVIVDMREFRSSLPSILHAGGFQVSPCTLEVGDYVLSPAMCVERKSISDLIQSFSSGRLYSQAEAMSSYYKDPLLLIEFDHTRAFSLQSSEVKSDSAAYDLAAKLVLLTLHFPKLRLLWSSSPHASTEMFQDLKKNQGEPSAEAAMEIGVEHTRGSSAASNSTLSPDNLTAQDILRALPGITSKNYKVVMEKVDSVYDLAQMTRAEMRAMLGDESGNRLFDFFSRDPKS
ncbi:DNA repair protein RAD16 [Sorochytrium milnesiophthora]